MPILTKLKTLFKGDPRKKIFNQYQPTLDKINTFEKELETLSDEQLQAKTPEFKSKIKAGTSLDDILPEAFAVVRETAKRVMKMRHFDVQMIGGVVLHQGGIAEMKTGEGKTLMSTLPAYLNALEGKGVYIVTVNDYLARRDSEWMGEIHRFLGLSIGLIQANMSPEDRLDAYKADITYGTNNEFGFDYLRDNLSPSKEHCCQTRRHFAIIDEVDSILIDEARTPLIISGPVKDNTSKYASVAKLVKTLERETHFTADEKHKNVVLTEDGIDLIETSFGLETMYSVKNMEIAHMAVQCLKAFHLFNKDVDYVVKDGEIVIVDEFTGRLMEGRRYSDGLHQAIEAIEGLKIQSESQTLASVTFQNYFRMFPKLGGMTGTAKTEAEEFLNIYGLHVESIPTNKPLARKDLSDLIYKSKEEKFKAIVKEIKERNAEGQPILVGTISIETSETISKYLQKEGIAHEVLNAKQHEKEAEIITKAGQKGSVTIATNMAGRGTDIVLGEDIKDKGLYVIGSSRHESRRIDNQLRGRSGRQGDPGTSRFYVSLDDDLMKLFGSGRIAKVMETLGLPPDEPIEHSLITRSIEKAQTKVEKYHFGIRKQILQYDDVLNKQRETIYTIRRDLLEKENLDSVVNDFILQIVKSYIQTIEASVEKKLTDSHAKELAKELSIIFPINNLEQVITIKQNAFDTELLLHNLKNFYQFRKQQYPNDIFEEYITRRILLMNLDRKWMDHLNNMDLLREGIGLRAYGNRNPLVEYKREGFDMFQALLLDIGEEALQSICRAVLVEEPNAEAIEGSKKKKKKMSQA